MTVQGDDGAGGSRDSTGPFRIEAAVREGMRLAAAVAAMPVNNLRRPIFMSLPHRVGASATSL